MDACEPFIDELRARLTVTHGAVDARVGDMLAPGVEPASLDLIWCEGAAYAVGVERALAAWRPLLRPDGFVVFSECCWIASGPPAECAAFWADAYPAMTTPAGTGPSTVSA